ncbi:O-acetyltransferase OatA [Tritonibacter multivorans]|uniref:O-acetyltransferase OatA n=1 Tax=Tritonibacter multivorans TaxID=928856 RepID=A0A0P1GTQ1_9RHOB|nr:acyltransferase family protein [Tritonibacter multivorans]MDA7421427.1 acyltransferase family protein [Tritonibacter multivorans]CUH78797.1 O-acetyltransferase OatA [Tritonibacter multivorans]SFD29394.1 Peptidoglycan/LPS O-acetylase OafA/YrhL, contains acyltransferase and SGNH-hydrolase domains [Tritonibacter multivorans]
MKYRSEIDGLRSVAVLPVILFHAGFTAFGGGFVGVDVFFVISGYLITTIIVDELAQGKFSILKFYERRARRILPALFVVCLVSLVMAWMFLLKHDFKDFARSIVATATFSSNIYFWLESDYFDTAAELKPLLHTWSLAVEEQFYIFFPPLLMLLFPKGQRFVVFSLGVLFTLSLIGALWLLPRDTSGAFYLLPTRAWELLIGSFCALYLRGNVLALPVLAQNTLSALGLGMIGYSVFTFSKFTPTPGLTTLLPTVGTALIILFARPGTFVQKLLSLRAMVGIGLISYSAYLWHQPLFSFARHNALHEPPWQVMVALIALTLLLAWASWKFIETPLRHSTASQNRVFVLSSGGLAAFLAVGLFVNFNAALPYGNGRYNLLDKEANLLRFENNNKRLQEQSWAMLRSYAKGLECVGDCSKGNNDRKWFDEQDSRLRLLLVGNSHSKDVFNLLHLSPTAAHHLQVGRFNAQISNLTKDHRLFANTNYQMAEVVMIASRYKIVGGNDINNLQPLVEQILSDGKTVILLKNVFEFPIYLGGKWTHFDKLLHEAMSEGLTNGPEISERSDRDHYALFESGKQDQRVTAANAEIARIQTLYPQVLVLDRMDFVCSRAEQRCFTSNGQLEKYFPDYGHYTVEGAKVFSKRMEDSGWLQPILTVSEEALNLRN